ncbi:MAG TPA: glycosyltransferase family 9 protein [Thermoleophilaceae bacterium]|nr:glycosyltransferase family 9 protein [Thermoleophilaceae bacterium]
MHTAWATARNLLCVRLDSIGDVLMTGPALRALRDSGARITLLTSPQGALAAELMPEVDETIVYEAPWMKATPERSSSAPDREVVETLATRGFDGAAIFTVYSQSPLPAALLCQLADIPLRLAHCRENPYQLLTHHVPEREPEELVRHEVQRQLDLVACVGARTADERLALGVPDTERMRADDLLAELGVNRARPWAVIHPGATAPSRRYPAESWGEVCRVLAGGMGVQLVLTGDPTETELVAHVQRLAGLDGRSLAGRLDLAALAGLLEAAPLLVAGNTGPVHVAAAVGTPVVDLYALTNPQHTPWGVPHRVLSQDVPCRWCYKSVCPEGHHRCLRGVSPGEVVDAALTLLELTQRPVPGPCRRGA